MWLAATTKHPILKIFVNCTEVVTRGKKKITDRFNADPGAMAGGIFDLRILHGEKD